MPVTIRGVAAAALLILAPSLGWAAGSMPPEISEIMRRMGTGARPSAEDQRKVEAWAATMGSNGSATTPGSPAADPDDTQTLTASDRPGGEACPAPGHAVGLAALVDKAAYLAMAQDTVRGYGQQAPRDGRTALEAALADRSAPVAGADVAVALVARGYGSAAAIAAARGAIANPADPNTANTLGTVLRGMQDYRRATIAFDYAASLSPGSATLANNRGWLALSQGDGAAATSLFSKAAQIGPPSPTVLLGQALIAECAGNHAQALPLFRASLALQWSDMAAAGVQWAEGSLQKAAGPGADLGSPEEYGGKAGGETPDWPDPPLPGTAQELAANLSVGYKNSGIVRFANGWNDAVAANLKVATANPARRSETVIDATSTTLTYGYDRQLFILDDIAAMIVARDAAKADRFTQQTANAIERDGTMMHNNDPGADSQSCGAVRGRNTSTYLGYGADAKGRWTDVRKAMADLYGFSRTTLASIDDPPTNASAGAILDSRANLMAVGYSADILLWTLETDAAWRFKDFQCAKVAAVHRPAGRLKPYKIDPTPATPANCT